MSRLNVKDLLLAPRLDREQAAELLRPYGFRHPEKADANLQGIADDPAERELLADILEELLKCASQSADPDQAIKYELLHTLNLLDNEQRQLDYLRFYKRRETLHIGVRDLLRLCTVQETLTALSVLAEVLIGGAHWISASAMRREHHIPKDVFTS